MGAVLKLSQNNLPKFSFDQDAVLNDKFCFSSDLLDLAYWNTQLSFRRLGCEFDNFS
jgi:hypothetical protein